MNVRLVVLSLCCCLNWPAMANAKNAVSVAKKQQVISEVDTSLEGSQKYVLRVGGKPYYMTNVQVRLDLLRYSEEWSMELCEKLIAQIAADGFNTISVPVQWVEVEPERDKFDWKILDSYLKLTNKYGLKMELLWFGANSGGHVQWLGRPSKNAVHLRTPDYVLDSPAPSSKETTSDYAIRRDLSDYTLDIADTNLRDRETEVLKKVMNHIAEWDVKNGHKHPVIGVQINNEFLSHKIPFSNPLAIDYLNTVAGGVKESDYVVWTRANCVFWNMTARIHGNEAHRLSDKTTNLDFVGLDTYRMHFPTDASFVASMRENVPYVGKNFRMIMETNSEIPVSAQIQLAALSGNSSLDYYTIEGMYGRDGDNIVPLVGHLDDVRRTNRMLLCDPTDLATKAHGYGLYVHNWEGVNGTATTSNSGISYSPYYPTSQGVSIMRGDGEVVLMSTGGGRFSLPKGMVVERASRGHFDIDNRWVKEGDIKLGKRQAFDSAGDDTPSLFVEGGTAVLLECKPTGEPVPSQILQAEFALLSPDAKAEYDIRNIGFAGNGYVKLPAHEGASIVWNNVDGKEGGDKIIRLRYSLEDNRPAELILTVNGKPQKIKLAPTGGGDKYGYLTILIQMQKGKNNIIRLETVYNYFSGNGVFPAPAGNIDEFQVM